MPRPRPPARRHRAPRARPATSRFVATSPSVRPLNRGLRSFSVRSTAAVRTGASARRARSSAVASACESKLPTETRRPSAGTISGFPWCAFSSKTTWLSTNRSASRAAPCTCGTHRNVSGSWRKRAAPGSQSALPSSSEWSRVSVSPRPSEPRATAISGCSAPTLPRNASKSSAAAASIQRTSPPASWTASAACPVEYALPTRSAIASPASSAEFARARRGRDRRSGRGRPDRPCRAS